VPGSGKCFTSVSKAKASVAPSTLIDSPIPPWRVIEVIRVVFLPRFLGTFPQALFPLGALALRRVMEV